MKIIDNQTLIKILEKLTIDINKIKYYTSGKCSDLYFYNDKVIKIMKWYVKYDTEDILNDKFNFKINFVNYLSKNNFDCLKLSELNGNYFKIISIDRTFYVIYEMNYLSNICHDNDKNLVAILMKSFHELSKKYESNNKNISWEEEYNSVYFSCIDNRLKGILKEYYDKFMLLEKSNDTYGVIHYDSNNNNYVMSNNKMYLIDFDTMCYGWYLMDVANYLFSLFNINIFKGVFMDIGELKNITTVFLKNYGFDYSKIAELNLFFNYRLVFLYSILNNVISDESIRNKIENIIYNDNIKLC